MEKPTTLAEITNAVILIWSTCYASVDSHLNRKQQNSSRQLITFVTDRQGHDRRYALDSTKIQTELGWQLAEPFETGIQKTVDWYLEHRAWWEKVRSGEYREYYAVQYENRLKQP